MSVRACGRCDELRRALGGCSLNADEAREIAGDALRADAAAARCLSERLDEVSAAHNDATDEVRRLTEQRDALLAACEAMSERFHVDSAGWHHEGDEESGRCDEDCRACLYLSLAGMIDAAIAKARPA